MDDPRKGPNTSKGPVLKPPSRREDRFYEARSRISTNRELTKIAATGYEDQYEETLKSLQKNNRSELALLFPLESWAFLLHELGEYDKAKDANERALEIRRRINRSYDPEHPTKNFRLVHQNLAGNYEKIDKKKAVSLWKENHQWCQRDLKPGDNDREVLKVGTRLAASLRMIRDYSGAEYLDRNILAHRRILQAPELEIVESRVALAKDKIFLGSFEPARVLLEKNLEALNSRIDDKILLEETQKTLKLCEEKIQQQEKQSDKQERKRMKHAHSKERDTNETIVNLMKSNATNYDDQIRKLLEESRGPTSEHSSDAKEKKGKQTDINQVNPKIVNYDDQLKAYNANPTRGRIEPELKKHPPNASQHKLVNKGQADPQKMGNINKPRPKSQTGSSPSPSIPLTKPMVLEPPSALKTLDHNTANRRPNSRNTSPNIVNVEFRPRSNSHIPLAGTSDVDQPPSRESPKPSKSESQKTGDKEASTKGNYSTVREPVPTSTDTAASKGKELSPNETPLRPKSASFISRNMQKAFQPPLFDAKEGGHDEASNYAVDGWFHDLQIQTQELLKPLRKDRCKRVKIAILDTGIDLNHPKFSTRNGKRIRRINTVEDFLDSEGQGQDICGHGTHCLGLLRQVAPEADIFVARVVKDSEGKLDPEIIAKAINRASRSGKDDAGIRNWNVDIITISCGFYSWVEVVKTAIDEALMKPTLIFAAASNNGTRKKVAFPAYMPGVICVNSSTANGTPSDFNPTFDASRPFSILGENVSSSWISDKIIGQENEKHNDERKRMSGTSVATPICAAIAALVHEFLHQTDPGDEALDELLKQQQTWLSGYNGMIEIFNLMSEQRGGYRNIIPWNILSVDFERGGVAHLIRVAIMKKFGKV